MNPPRAAARAPKQTTEIVYYSDSTEEEIDEELQAMQNIRKKGRRRHVVGHCLAAYKTSFNVPTGVMYAGPLTDL